MLQAIPIHLYSSAVAEVFAMICVVLLQNQAQDAILLKH